MILTQKFIENFHCVVVNYWVLPIVSILHSAKEIEDVCSQAKKTIDWYVYPNSLAIWKELFNC